VGGKLPTQPLGKGNACGKAKPDGNGPHPMAIDKRVAGGLALHSFETAA
jgi:hypothetical protein